MKSQLQSTPSQVHFLTAVGVAVEGYGRAVLVLTVASNPSTVMYNVFHMALAPDIVLRMHNTILW